MDIAEKNKSRLCLCAKAPTVGSVFLSLILCFYAGGCGKPPASMPDPYTGALNVTVMDTASVDSVFIKLDDDNPAKHENPTLIEDIMIGIHKVFVFNEASAGTTKTVEIFRDRKSDILFWLATTGPYVGNLAPDFSTTDIKGNPVSLSGLKGKVVLLVFFEHTWQDCIQTELPSLQWVVGADFTSDQLAIMAINFTTTVTWLKNYVAERGLSYPFILDDGSIKTLYQVGASYGNIPPTYFIIDQQGTVQYRTDDMLNQFENMKTKIQELLSASL